MVLIGHVTIRTGQSGPFGYLWKLHSGDEVVYRAGDTDYTYSIRDKREVLPEEVSRLYVADGQRLLLITCADWDYVTRTYPKRLIVQAELVRQASARRLTSLGQPAQKGQEGEFTLATPSQKGQ